jgi:phage tail sheath protein FI
MGRTVQRQTPGVYITELASFPPSVVSVQTAIPAFIGYTEKSKANGKSIAMTPTAIYSLADYTSLFGAGFRPLYSIGSPESDASPYDFSVKQIDGTTLKFVLTQVGASAFNLYNSLRLFYANGGGAAYVVSVGDYTADGTVPGGVSIEATKLVAGLDAVKDQNGPTMLVVPDAVLLTKEADFYTVTDSMLAQCGKTQSRVAVLDVWGTQTLSKVTTTDAIDAVITPFREKIGSKNLSYGMAYFPFLATSIIKSTEVDYCWLQVDDEDQFKILRN